MPTATRERESPLLSLSGGKTNGRTRMLGRSDARRTAREQKPDTRVTLNRAEEKRRRLPRPMGVFNDRSNRSVSRFVRSYSCVHLGIKTR